MCLVDGHCAVVVVPGVADRSGEFGTKDELGVVDQDLGGQIGLSLLGTDCIYTMS